MISGLVEQQGKVVLFPSDYVCEEIQEVYWWKGITTPHSAGLLFEDLPIHKRYDQFPYLRACGGPRLLVYVTANLQSHNTFLSNVS